MVSSPSLTELPHRSLLRIIQHVDDSDDLFQLALSSRRLNQLAMPSFFSRQGIPIQQSSQAAFVHVFLPEQHHILAAFRLGFFINSIQGLSCIITARPADRQKHTFLRDVEALVMLFRTYRLRIKRVTIHSKVDSATFITQYEIDSRICKAAFDSRGSCSELELGDDNGDRRTYSRGWDYDSPSCFEMLRQASFKGTGLASRYYYTSSYTFKTNRQLLIPRLPSTLALLRHTYSLDLSAVEIWGCAWSKLLSDIATTVRHSLQMLKINPTRIYPTDLLVFLSRLTSLVALTIDPPNTDTQPYYQPFYAHQHFNQRRHRDQQRQHNASSPDSYDPLKHPLRPSFPKLLIISAPLNLLPFLLSGSTPKLQSITITINRASTLFSPSSEKLFAQTATLLDRRTSLMPKRKQSSAEGKPHLTMNVTFDLPEIWCMSVNLNDFFRTGIGGRKSERFFKMVESLAVISRSPYPFPGDEMSTSVLCQWLRRFPGVKYLAIEDMHRSFPPIFQDPQQFFLRYRSWGQSNQGYPGRHRYYSAVSVYAILHALRVQCPNVVTVILDQCYEVEYVLEEREGGSSLSSSRFSRFKSIRDGKSSGTENEKEKQKYRGLGDLNEDIFYLIFQHLDTKELYPLSRISRNLLCWVLPVYLYRRGFPPNPSIPSSSIFTNGAPLTPHIPTPSPPPIEISLFIDSMDPLLDISALTLSPSIHTISQLSLSLHSGVSLYRAYEFLQRLLRLLKKLQRVGKLRLDFGGIMFSSNGGMAEKSATTGGAKKVWTGLVMELFGEVGRKCGGFVVGGCGYFQSLTGSWGEVFGEDSGSNVGDLHQEAGGKKMVEMDEKKVEKEQKAERRRSIIESLPVVPKLLLSRSHSRGKKRFSISSSLLSSISSPIASPSPPPSPPPSASPFQKTTMIVKGEGHQFAKLKIESDALLLPVFRDWARSALRASSGLSKLRVTKLTYLTVPFLRSLFVDENIDADEGGVRDLKLTGDTVMMEDVLGVIRCFNQLERLEIKGCCSPSKSGGNCMGGGGGGGGFGTKLRHLKRLSAPAEYVVQLFRGVGMMGLGSDKDEVGAELEELAVRVIHRRDPDGMLRALRTVAPIVNRLIKRREARSMGTSADKGKTGEAASPTSEQQQNPLPLLLSLDMYLQPVSASPIHQDNDDDDDNYITTRGWEAVARVTSELTFRFDDRFDPDDSSVLSTTTMGAGWLPEQITFEVQGAFAIATNTNPNVAIPGLALNVPPGGGGGGGTATGAPASLSGYVAGAVPELRRWLELFPCVRKLILCDAPIGLSTKAILEWMDLGQGRLCPRLETVVVNGQSVDLVKGVGKGKGKWKER